MKKQVLTILAVTTLSAALSAQAIPNAGFETWGHMIDESDQPTSWISYNVFTLGLIDPGNTNPTSVTPAGTPDNYQGTYSAKIETIDLVTNPSSTSVPNRAGLLMTGVANFTSPYLHPGYSSQQRPQTLTYYAKYTPSGVDTAYCLVLISKWNSTTSTRDTVAWGIDYIPLAVASYSLRTLTLQYNAAQVNTIPDSCTILFSASSAVAPQAGSMLWVDAVAFSGYVGIDDASINNSVDVYPNPSSTVTNFDVSDENAYAVVAYDMTGREVKRTAIYNKKAVLDSYTMTPGIYTYAIVTDDNQVLSRGKFSVAQ